MILRLTLFIGSLLLCGPSLAAVHKSHAITLYDEPPKYAEGFTHFDYVNPNAPKGGTFRVAPQQSGTFDSFNPFISKGVPVSTGAVESLLTASLDEPSTNYGLIAEYIEWPDDRDWVIFHLNPQARWHDGKSISADDVVWSFHTLLEKGAPVFKYNFANVDKVEKLDDKTVKFSFNEKNNRELPIVVGGLPILPKHYWEGRDFTKTTLEPPLGSGPYQISKFEAGRFVEQTRVKDYWGSQLGVNKGLDNFDQIRTDFFRDGTAIRLGLKAGDFDFHQEFQSKAWATEFENLEAIETGDLIKTQVSRRLPIRMQGLIFNTRREMFKDPVVREALSYAFDFEWTNKSLFHNQYSRTRSYFQGSELAATGKPSKEELELLEPYRNELPERIFTEEYNPPSTDSSGWPRDSLLKADSLLKQAGWVVRDLHRVNAQTGEPFEFEILLHSQGMERIMLPMVRNFERLGIKAKIRIVDITQYLNRTRKFDFDTMISVIVQSENPGNEQRGYWTKEASEQEGSRNLAGVSSDAVDELVNKIISSGSRKELILNTRTLDRVLQFGFYAIPNWYLAADRVLYWNKFGMPDTPLKVGVTPSRWWFDEKKANLLSTGFTTKDSQGTVSTSREEKGASNSKLLIIVALLCLGVFMLKKYFRREN